MMASGGSGGGTSASGAGGGGLGAKINAKNMDYFKFKKMVIDGDRTDYESCSREIKAICDAVQTLAFRDDQFADEEMVAGSPGAGSAVQSDQRQFEEITSSYRAILAGKRIDPVDIRVKSGWWADVGATSGSCGSVGKFKASALRDTLISKSNDWRSRHQPQQSFTATSEDLDRPGVFVFKHHDPRVFNILENDLILKHDSIWPRGLNRMLRLTTAVEVSELRNSCLRHHWPTATEIADAVLADIDLNSLRKRLQSATAAAAAAAAASTPVSGASKDVQSAAKPPSAVTKSAEKTHHQAPNRSVASTNGADGSTSTALPSPSQRQIAGTGNASARPKSARSTGNQAHQPNPSTPRARPSSAPKPVVSPTASHPPPARTSGGLPSVSTSHQTRPHSASTSASGTKLSKARPSGGVSQSSDVSASYAKVGPAPLEQPPKKRTASGIPSKSSREPPAGNVERKVNRPNKTTTAADCQAVNVNSGSTSGSASEPVNEGSNTDSARAPESAENVATPPQHELQQQQQQQQPQDAALLPVAVIDQS